MKNINAALILGLPLLALLTGCASGEKKSATAAPDATKYLGHKSVPTANISAGEKCTGLVSELKDKNWKTLVKVANACAHDKNWRSLEVVGNQLSITEMNSPWGAYYLSVAADQRGDTPRAMWMLDLAIKKAGPDVGLFQYQKGRMLWKLGELDKGMTEVLGAVKKDANLIEGHLFLGQVYFRDQEFDTASKHFQLVLEGEPKSAIALSGLAECRLQQGSAKAAVELLTKAVSHYPDSVGFRVRLAYVYEELEKDPEQALSAYVGIRELIKKGKVREQLGFDLTAKIKTLETTVNEAISRKQASVNEPKPVERSKK